MTVTDATSQVDRIWLKARIQHFKKVIWQLELICVQIVVGVLVEKKGRIVSIIMRTHTQNRPNY